MGLSISSGIDMLNAILALGLLIRAASIAVPPLGRRIHGGFWPPLFADPAQRRAAWLRAGLVALACLCAGYYFASQLLIPLVCGGQRLMINLQIIAIMIGCAGLVGASIVQRRHRLVSQRPPRSILPRRLALPLLGLGALLLVGLCAGSIAAFRRISASPVYFESIAMESPDAGWAIGSQSFSSAVYRLSGGEWTRAEAGNVGLLADIDLTGPGEGWAVGNNETMLRLSGGAWSKVPAPAGQLRAIDMVSADDGWAVGSGGVILRYRDGAWAPVASPTEASLEDISMVSADDGWAVGGGDYSQRAPSVILRYQDGRWALADNPTDLPLSAIHMLSANAGWAVGGTRFGPVARVILRYRDGAWAAQPAPPGIPLNDIRMESADAGWAVGGGFFSTPLDCAEAARSAPLSALLRYENGAWREAAAPATNGIDGITIDGAGSAWAVGPGAILRYESGDWRVTARPE